MQVDRIISTKNLTRFSKEVFDRYFFRYIVIGIVNTIAGYGTIFSLMFYFSLIPEISNFFGYLVGILISYILNKKFNFKSKGSHKKELPKFIIGLGIAYFVNLLVLFISYRFLNINMYLAQFIAGCFYVITGYLMSKYFAFRKESRV